MIFSVFNILLIPALMDENMTGSEQNDMFALLKMSADSSYVLLKNLLMRSLSEQGNIQPQRSRIPLIVRRNYSGSSI